MKRFGKARKARMKERRKGERMAAAMECPAAYIGRASITFTDPVTGASRTFKDGRLFALDK